MNTIICGNCGQGFVDNPMSSHCADGQVHTFGVVVYPPPAPTYDEQYEATILEALQAAKGVQDFLWGADQSIYVDAFDAARWAPLFQKRVDKISEIRPDSPHWKVELRKRLLQQAALSLRAMIALANK